MSGPERPWTGLPCSAMVLLSRPRPFPRPLPRPRARTRPVAGRYLLLEELGRGATGVVHRAWDVRAGRYVAAKVLRGGDVDAVVGFVRESAHRIVHPHVVTPLGWAAEDDV